jgi:type IV pilus assembly protein PilW
MMPIRRLPSSRRKQSGVTLIELMVALVLGLLVSAGIIAVFSSTSKSNQVQRQLSRVQEEGRFAVARLKDDLRMANAQYCSSTGGVASQNGNANNIYMDQLRAPTAYVAGLGLYDNTTPFGNPYPASPTAPYPLPSYLFMRGYDCNKAGTCTPASPPTGTGQLPAQGTAIGDRVVGSSVLTIRYFDASKGWSIGANDSVVTTSNGTLTKVSITRETGEPALSTFQSGDLAMLADCANAAIFAVNRSGGDFTPSGGNLSTPKFSQTLTAPRLFDFNTDFVTVTYYLKVVSDDGTASGTKTGALMRRVNGGDASHGGSEQELVRGVERLDFRYVVNDQDGLTHYLTAAQVDNNAGGSIACPMQPAGSLTDKGCLWRAVKAIEVHLLVDGQKPMATLTDNELAYLYTPDNSYSAAALTPEPPSNAAHTIKPSDQGFARGMMRREFSALISVRNYNP